MLINSNTSKKKGSQYYNPKINMQAVKKWVLRLIKKLKKINLKRLK